MKNNTFYTCLYTFLFIFETKEAAKNAYKNIGAGEFSEEAAQSTARAWTNTDCSIIGYTKPKETIFLINGIKSVDDDENYFYYCNVIVGEKIGWILNESWCIFEVLERDTSD
jgi:hypothetical protein